MQDYFSIPQYCPTCSSFLVEEGSFLYCRNKSCSSKLAGTINVWVEKLGIMNWGEALINSLINECEDLSDIYNFSVEKLAFHCSGLKHAKKCYDSLHDNKDIKLELLLSSINIPLLGISTASDIINAGFDSIQKIISMTESDLVKVPNIGIKTASILIDGIHEKRLTLIKLEKVLNVKSGNAGPLKGYSFCITGSTSIPRPSLKKKIIDFGGTYKDTVVSGLSYLITNEDATSYSSDKFKKAKKYNTKIISESDLMNLLK